MSHSRPTDTFIRDDKIAELLQHISEQKSSIADIFGFLRSALQHEPPSLLVIANLLVHMEDLLIKEPAKRIEVDGHYARVLQKASDKDVENILCSLKKINDDVVLNDRPCKELNICPSNQLENQRLIKAAQRFLYQLAGVKQEYKFDSTTQESCRELILLVLADYINHSDVAGVNLCFEYFESLNNNAMARPAAMLFDTPLSKALDRCITQNDTKMIQCLYDNNKNFILSWYDRKNDYAVKLSPTSFDRQSVMHLYYMGCDINAKDEKTNTTLLGRLLRELESTRPPHSLSAIKNLAFLVDLFHDQEGGSRNLLCDPPIQASLVRLAAIFRNSLHALQRELRSSKGMCHQAVNDLVNHINELTYILGLIQQHYGSKITGDHATPEKYFIDAAANGHPRACYQRIENCRGIDILQWLRLAIDAFPSLQDSYYQDFVLRRFMVYIFAHQPQSAEEKTLHDSVLQSYLINLFQYGSPQKLALAYRTILLPTYSCRKDFEDKDQQKRADRFLSSMVAAKKTDICVNVCLEAIFYTCNRLQEYWVRTSETLSKRYHDNISHLFNQLLASLNRKSGTYEYASMTFDTTQDMFHIILKLAAYHLNLLPERKAATTGGAITLFTQFKREAKANPAEANRYLRIIDAHPEGMAYLVAECQKNNPLAKAIANHIQQSSCQDFSPHAFRMLNEWIIARDAKDDVLGLNVEVVLLPPTPSEKMQRLRRELNNLVGALKVTIHDARTSQTPDAKFFRALAVHPELHALRESMNAKEENPVAYDYQIIEKHMTNLERFVGLKEKSASTDIGSIPPLGEVGNALCSMRKAIDDCKELGDAKKQDASACHVQVLDMKHLRPSRNGYS